MVEFLWDKVNVIAAVAVSVFFFFSAFHLQREYVLAKRKLVLPSSELDKWCVGGIVFATLCGIGVRSCVNEIVPDDTRIVATISAGVTWYLVAAATLLDMAIPIYSHHATVPPAVPAVDPHTAISAWLRKHSPCCRR